MTRRRALWLLGGLARAQAQERPPDWRDIANGSVIPGEGYADQPYVVRTGDSHWLCVMTTGTGAEGAGGQHVIALRSADRGRTWSAPVDIEPASGPEASWATPLLTPSGRIYVFYTYNNENVRIVPNVASPAIARRVDTLGIWAFRYSDDHGRTWSKDRFEVPLPPWDGDRINNFEGQQRFFWSVAKPVVDRGTVFIGLARISRWGLPGVLMESTGFVAMSSNLLAERDPARIRWSFSQPLRAPKGPIAEETNITPMSDGSLYALYRTIDGYACHAYSKDRGMRWSAPAYATFANGRPVKNPRAFCFARRFSNGKYLMWFHNQGGEAVHARARWDFYQDRNPGWVCGGVERHGRIAWSEPEILLHASDPKIRMSYPDFIEEPDGRIYITETQKSIARVHEIDGTFLRKLWAEKPLDLSQDVAVEKRGPGSFAMPSLDGRGFTLSCSFSLRNLYPDQLLIDARGAAGKGLALMTGDRFNLKLVMNDGRKESIAESDFGTHPGTLRSGVRHAVAITVDGAARIVMFVVDGVLNDGGPARQFGWTRFDASLADLSGDWQGTSKVALLRLFHRPLMTCEAMVSLRETLRP